MFQDFTFPFWLQIIIKIKMASFPYCCRTLSLEVNLLYPSLKKSTMRYFTNVDVLLGNQSELV